MLKWYLLAVILLLTVAIVFSTHLPWWGAILLIFATFVVIIKGTILLVKRWFRKAMKQGLAEMGKPLDGATVTINSVTVTDQPPTYVPDDDDEDEDEEDEDEHDVFPNVPDLTPVRWIAIDMTVNTPPLEAGDTGEHEWTPQAFVLVPYNANPPGDGSRMMDLFLMRQAMAHYVEHLSLDGSEVTWQSPTVDEEADAEDGEDLEGSCSGTCRVRLVFGIPEEMPRTVKLRYAMHEFCELEIP